MPSRRRWIEILLTSIAAVFAPRQVGAQQGFSNNAAERLGEQNIVSLEDQLENGLRVVTPEQQAFVNVVVQAVNQGRLPRAMVNLVYEWSLERNPRIPFPYFQFAIKVLAKKRGIYLS